MKKSDMIASLAIGLGVGYAAAYMQKHPIKVKAMKNDIKNMVKDLK